MSDDKFYEELSRLINSAFDISFNRQPKKEKIMQTQPKLEPTVSPDRTAAAEEVYESIEEYTSRTGKRFRMLKDQKTRGLTREEAFTETFGGSV